MEKEIVIDSSGGVLGRIAAFAVKSSLKGTKVVIVNCNEALITGRKESILRHYKHERALGGASLKGPHFPRSPARIMKRTVRGMLPYRKGRGSTALKQIICYPDVPEKYKDKKKITLKRDLKVKTIKLSELDRLL